MAIIPIDTQLSDFKDYLDNNDRCILSARFGDGKSFFLNNFIKKYKKEYLFIPIYPVNYQVAENKDIFEYIKRDILIRLLTCGEITLDDNAFSKAKIIWNYLKGNKKDIIFDLLENLPTIQISFMEFDMQKLVKTIREHWNAVEEESQSLDSNIENFLSDFDNMQGSIYEFDWMSQLICDINDKYRKDKKGYNDRKGKKIVLVIEDLDRIDPAHIFRILNVFSAHFERQCPNLTELEKNRGHNKLQFDKIITVCHYENIQHIYAHMYGDKTDFKGYIDKFSPRPFRFSLVDKLKEFIIDNIHSEIKPYTLICEILAHTILAKYNHSTEILNNLRSIVDALKAPLMIRDQTLSVTVMGGSYFINAKSNFTILLDVLRNLNIGFDDFVKQKERLQSEANKDTRLMYDCQYCKLINICWLIAAHFDKNIDFQISSGKLITSPESITVNCGTSPYRRAYLTNMWQFPEGDRSIVYLDKEIAKYLIKNALKNP